MNTHEMPWFSVDNHIFSQPSEVLIHDSRTADDAEDIVYCANRLHDLRAKKDINAYDSFCSFLLAKMMTNSEIENL